MEFPQTLATFYGRRFVESFLEAAEGSVTSDMIHPEIDELVREAGRLAGLAVKISKERRGF